MPKVTRKRPSPPVFDEARFQEALAELKRLAHDDSDTTWQDNLPEAPPLPESPDEAVVQFVSRKAEHMTPPKPTTGRRRNAPGHGNTKAT
jgi:hypothetical protein